MISDSEKFDRIDAVAKSAMTRRQRLCTISIDLGYGPIHGLADYQSPEWQSAERTVGRALTLCTTVARRLTGETVAA